VEPHSAGARDLWFAGVRVVVRVDAAQSQGRLGVWESEEPRGVGLPLHVHTREDEQVVVLDGEIRMTTRSSPPSAGSGSRSSGRHRHSTRDDRPSAPLLVAVSMEPAVVETGFQDLGCTRNGR
jgi:hypothetical protein